MRLLTLFFIITWFYSCKNSTSHSSNASNNNTDYEALGANITAQSQGAILSQLSHVMQTQGVEAALEYCNLNALNIMDSLSKKHKCQIRRTSLKLRNPANSPRNDDEVMLLQQFHEEYQQSKTLQSRLIERDGRYIYYKPIIIMMETCLKCHGKPDTQISSATLAKIQKLYPNDQAIHYEMNDFRGMWIVEFEK